MVKKKLRIGLIFGGRSAEHEVSLVSAARIIAHLDEGKYEIVPICITKQGTWLLGIEPGYLIADGQDITNWAKREQKAEAIVVVFACDPMLHRLIPLESFESLHNAGALDIIFPALHGTYGEDGTIQGLFEMANIPYVGCGVLGSALGMDKVKMKAVVHAAGLPVVTYLSFRRDQWERKPVSVKAAIERDIGYPCFVKPANLGSSIGVSKVHDPSELEHAMYEAGRYDRKILIERAINCRELECAVLGNDDLSASVIGEVIFPTEFYDYETKYISGNGTQKIIPAQIPQAVAEEVRHLAISAFTALDLSGLARIDFFLEDETGKVYFNEANTFPALSEFSMYSQLWQASGLSYTNLLDRLIELGIERHEERQRYLISLW